MLFDIDSETSIFRAQIESYCGYVHIPQNSNITYNTVNNTMNTMGNILNNTLKSYVNDNNYNNNDYHAYIDFQGIYNTIKVTLQNISYESKLTCSAQDYNDFLTVKIMNIDNYSQNISGIIPIHIERVNDPPKIFSQGKLRFYTVTVICLCMYSNILEQLRMYYLFFFLHFLYYFLFNFIYLSVIFYLSYLFVLFSFQMYLFRLLLF